MSPFNEISCFLKYILEVLERDRVLSTKNLSVEMASTWGEDAALTILAYFRKHLPHRFYKKDFEKEVGIEDVYNLFSHKQDKLQEIHKIITEALDVFGWPPGVIEDILNCESGQISVFIRSRTFDAIAVDDIDDIETLWKSKKWSLPTFLEEVLKNYEINLGFSGLTLNIFHQVLKNHEQFSSRDLKEVYGHPRINTRVLGRYLSSSFLSKFTEKHKMVMFQLFLLSGDTDTILKFFKALDKDVNFNAFLGYEIETLRRIQRGHPLAVTELMALFRRHSYLFLNQEFLSSILFTAISKAKIDSVLCLNRLLREIKAHGGRNFVLGMALRLPDVVEGEVLKEAIRYLRGKIKTEGDHLPPNHEKIYQRLRSQALKTGLTLHGIWG